MVLSQRRRRVLVLAMAATVIACIAAVAPAGALAARPATPSAAPDFGPHTIVFDPSMSQASIQSTLNTIATEQVPNQFGTDRYAILFEPGTYGSSTDPLIFQVGYYTEVAGLGQTPGDVVINGAIDVFNQCLPSCDGLDNFWRSLSNVTLNVTLPATPPTYVPATNEDGGCDNSNEMWAVSQAAPMRRVIMNGTVTLQDYCAEGFVSGGFLADDEFNGGTVINAGQQQFFTRNSNLDGWTNSVWNQVFVGDNGAPATDFGNADANQYTTVPTTPVSEEEPFLYMDGSGNYNVFVPAPQLDSAGPSYAGGPEAGSSLPISDFEVASPSTPVTTINRALAKGENLILTPGVYNLSQPIRVTRANTIVLGLGFATLIPQRATPALETSNAPGIKLSGMIFDAGPAGSPELLRVGASTNSRDNAGDPTLLQDVFFRIGGAEAGQATDALVVNTNNTILDDAWLWRADHGAGAGWTTNPANTGLVVNGNGVIAYGLAVEHFEQSEVVWNGQNGQDFFFQNEMPYDPPSQAAWMQTPSIDGYPAFEVSPNVSSFHGYGMGSYSFFDQGLPIFATQAFEAPVKTNVRFTDLLTIFLNATGGSGGINSVIDGVGAPSVASNADSPVDVASFP
jgi:hypothetical protein